MTKKQTLHKKRFRSSFNNRGNSMTLLSTVLLGDSRKYKPPILVRSSAKRIATQILVIAKLSGKEIYFESFCL